MSIIQARFFDLARLKQQFDADSEVSLRDLRERDQKIAADLPPHISQSINNKDKARLSQLLAWLEACENKDAVKKHAHLEGFILFSLSLGGLLLGVLSMSGLLLSDSQQPVNVLVFLAIFVVLQWILLLLTVVSAFSPFTQSTLNSPLSFMNPVTLALKRSLRSLSYNMPWEKVPQLTRFAILRWGQCLGIAFNCALIMTFWIILFVSDRSFGWSSTINFSSDALHSLLQVISLPWLWLVNDAGVSAELISSTRFQSLQTQFEARQIQSMRQWWPFLIMSLFCYGLLPRVILLLVFQTLYRRHLRRSLLSYPGVNLVLDRLNSPVVNTSFEKSNSHFINVKETTKQSSTLNQSNVSLVDWAGALKVNPGIDLADFGIVANTTIDAGLQLQEDQQAIEKINQQATATLVVAVKSWEPPLAELSDFLEALKSTTQCYVLLVPLAGTVVSNNEWKDWQHFASQNVTRPVQLLKADDKNLNQ